MSNATTKAQARAEYLADLKRITAKPDGSVDRDKFVEAIEQGCAALAQKAQKTRERAAEAVQGFVSANADAVRAHVDAELRALGDD